MQVQPPTPAQEPEIFPVDLETINTDLYKGKFLTPQMFLEEIQKMVHNAQVREYEDRDRLNKALAMYTAAEVSIQEFDAAFRLECERMADRELKRREQRRAEKRKSRQNSREQSVNGNASGMENGGPVRRSARANGLAPELKIQDPLLIERQLRGKRSRSQEPNGEVATAEVTDDREAKRKRLEAIIEMENEDLDELDILGQGPNSSVPRPLPSREPIQIEPLDEDMNDPYQTPSKPHRESSIHVSQPRSSGFDHLLNPQTPIEPMPDLTSFIHSESTTSMQALEPSTSNNLLNPFSTFDGTNTPLPSVPSSFAISPVHSANRFVPEPDPQIHASLTPDHPRTPKHHAPVHLTEPAALSAHDESESALAPVTEALPEVPPATAEQTQTESNANAMEVEVARTPSPPQPDFHVDEALLQQLEESFVQHTDRLNVEQLEQLRATSLNCIWKHRQEWDRDACVKELFTVITDFAQEAAEADSDEEGF